MKNKFQHMMDKFSHNKSAMKRRHMVQQLLFASVGLFILLIGVIAGYSLATREGAGDVRQQAAGEIQPHNVLSIAGFNCTGTRCNFANRDWRTCEGVERDGICWSHNGPGAYDIGFGPEVKCTPTHKAVKFHCPQGLDASGKCLGTGFSIFGGSVPAGGSEDLSREMLEQCGAYQFDFSDHASQDSNGNCGAVTYVWPNCGGGGGGGVTPPPPGATPTPTPLPPACTVDVVRRISGQNNVVINGETLRLNVGQTATLRAQVRNLPNEYEVESVTFRSQQTEIASFTPNEPTVDELLPFEAMFRVNQYSTTPARLRARVRLKHVPTNRVINDVTCETHVFLQPNASPTPTPTNSPTPTPSWTPTPTPTPTPITGLVCNAQCTADSQCSTGYCYQPPMPTCAPGLDCVQVFPPRVCRNRTHPTSATCEGPTPTPTNSPTPTPSWTPTPTPSFTPTPTPVIGCNKPCTQNADCSNAQHICVEVSGQRVCRLQSHIFSETCSPATPTPATTATVTPSVTPGLPDAGSSAVSGVVVVTAGLGILILGSLVFLLLL